MPSEANDVPAAPSEAVPLETAPSAAASVASGIPVSAVAGEPVLAEVEPMKTSAPANSEESSKSGEKRELGDSEGPIDSGSGAILMKEADCANGADDAPEETPAGESVTHPGAVNGAIDRGSVIDEPARMEIDSGKPSAELSTGTSAVREEQGIENQGGVGVDAGVDADAGSGAEKATGGEDSVKVGTPEAEEGTQTGPMVSIGLNVSRVNMFGLANYHFGRKETESKGQVARGVSEEEIAAHRQKRFEERGMRRSVAAVLLVHDHEFPHVLLLQQKGGGYSLPGGRLRPGESEEDGLRRKLHAKLSPVAAGDGEAPEWDIGDERACSSELYFLEFKGPATVVLLWLSLACFSGTNTWLRSFFQNLSAQSGNGGGSTFRSACILIFPCTYRNPRNSSCCTVLPFQRCVRLLFREIWNYVQRPSLTCTVTQEYMAQSSRLFRLYCLGYI